MPHPSTASSLLLPSDTSRKQLLEAAVANRQQPSRRNDKTEKVAVGWDVTLQGQCSPSVQEALALNLSTT